jgi:hypothetical protein
VEKTITTSCPFPLIKLKVNLKYAEVRKPSGVGYIILTLIKEAQDRKEKLASILKLFGVPDDLQFIFIDEIELLLSREILQFSSNNYDDRNRFDREWFDEYIIGNFEFTSNGERMFREGAILTGEKKAKELTVYYNPLTFEFLFNAPKCMALEQSSCYAAGFMQQVETDFTGLQEYLIDNARSAGLQKEERVLEYDIVEREDVVTKEEGSLVLRVDEDGMEVRIKTTGAEAFYKKYFTPDMLERELAAKNKFKFSVPAKNVKSFAEFKNLSAVYLPEEYEKQIKRPVKLLITRSKDKINIKRDNTEIALESGKIINMAADAISPDWSFITIDPKEMKFYAATKITLTERVLNKPVSVSLLTEQLYGDEEKSKVIKAIFGECIAAAFLIEYAKLIKTVYELLEDANFTARYITAKIKATDDRAKRVEILLTANDIYASIPQWQATAEQYANEIYNELIANMTEENASYTARLAKRLNGLRKPDENELLLAFAKKLDKLPKIKLFNLLTDAGYSENASLSVANVIEVYIGKILAGETELEKSKISDDFAALSKNFNDLKDSLGIRNTIEYAFRKNYNIDKFIDDYRMFKARLKNSAKKYSFFASSGYDELAKYEAIMQPVFDYLIIERNASNSPEKIDEKYIRSKINTGDWRTAISGMVVRLEYILGKRLGIEKGDNLKISEKIGSAKKEKIITESEANALYELRKFRNKLLHPNPTETQLTFDIIKISKWADTVFSIAESAPVDKKADQK